MFDITGDGRPLRVGWTQPGSSAGFLALDRNGNGTIDDGRELFGNFAPLSETMNGRRAKDGFEALKWFDDPAHGGNGDGLIDKRDAVFSKLMLWIDRNHNGISDLDELTGLGSAGIYNVSTVAQKMNDHDEHGNRITMRAPFDMVDASGARHTDWAYDVYFTTRLNTVTDEVHMKTAVLVTAIAASSLGSIKPTIVSPRAPAVSGRDVVNAVAQMSPAVVQSVQAKPVIVQEVDPVEPPEALDDFVAASDAVAHVKFLRSRSFVTEKGNVLTEQTAQVGEVFKHNSLLPETGSTIKIMQRAGSVDVGDHVIEVARQRVFGSAEEDVVFLHWNRSFGAFEIRNGQHGAYRLGNGVVETDSQSRLAKSLRALGRTEFVNRLRVLGAAGK